MALLTDRKFIHFNRKEDFLVLLNANAIADWQIVFIGNGNNGEEAPEIWTHGTYYGSVEQFLDETNKDSTNAISAAAVYKALADDEKVIAAALNDLNDKYTNLDSSKQDVISDLDTIRENAQSGASKVSNVQADWNATSGLAQILHKPDLSVYENKVTSVNGQTGDVEVVVPQSLLLKGITPQGHTLADAADSYYANELNNGEAGAWFISYSNGDILVKSSNTSKDQDGRVCLSSSWKSRLNYGGMTWANVGDILLVYKKSSLIVVYKVMSINEAGETRIGLMSPNDKIQVNKISNIEGNVNNLLGKIDKRLPYSTDSTNIGNAGNGAYTNVTAGRTNWLDTSTAGAAIKLGNLQIAIDNSGRLYSRNQTNNIWNVTNQLKTITETDLNNVFEPSVIGYTTVTNGPSETGNYTVYTFTSSDYDGNGFRSILQIAINRNSGNQYMRTCFKKVDGSGTDFTSTDWKLVSPSVTSVNGQTGEVTITETQLSKGTTTGTGNAVTDINVSNHQITLVKGATYATQSDIDTSIANLVDSAPETLDTLNELAAALGDDPNFATTVANQIGQKYTKPSTGIPASDLAAGVIPAAPGTLNTNNTTAQTVNSSEALSGTIKLHKISKTGSYSDLIKPSTGIPKTDLASAVQTSLGKADTAIQGVKVNGTALTPDANKTVNIDLTDYDKAPLIIEIDDIDTTVPSGTYASIGTALSQGKEVLIKMTMTEQDYEIRYYYFILNGHESQTLYQENYIFRYGEGYYVEDLYIDNNNHISKGKYTLASSTHLHGNIKNNGTLQTNDISIANGDKLIVTDSSDSSKIARASVSFDGSTTTKALTPKGTWETFYQKQSTGIPKTDLTSTVQTSLGKADSAIQGVKVNGTSVTPDSNKIVDITIPEGELSNNYEPSSLDNEDLELAAGDTYEEAFGKLEKSINDNEQITAAALTDLDSRINTLHLPQSLDDIPDGSTRKLSDYATTTLLATKQDTLVSGTNIKTINNESILGSGNITIQGGSGGDTNVIETVKVNGTALTPDANKAVDITVPTNVSDLNNDLNYIRRNALSNLELLIYDSEENKYYDNVALWSNYVIFGTTSSYNTEGYLNISFVNSRLAMCDGADIHYYPNSQAGFNSYIQNNLLHNGYIYDVDHWTWWDSFYKDIQICLLFNYDSTNPVCRSGLRLTFVGSSEPEAGTQRQIIVHYSALYKGYKYTLSIYYDYYNRTLISNPFKLFVEKCNIQSDWNETDTTSAAYIQNKPTIPAAVTESTVSGWGFTKNAGTVTGVKMNGTTKNPTSGVVDLGTVATANNYVTGGSVNSNNGTISLTRQGLSAASVTGLNTYVSNMISTAQTASGGYNDTYVAKAGDTMTGALTISADTANTLNVIGGSDTDGNKPILNVGTIYDQTILKVFDDGNPHAQINGTLEVTPSDPVAIISTVNSSGDTGFKTNGMVIGSGFQVSGHTNQYLNELLLANGRILVLPTFSGADNGKILGIQNGQLAWITPTTIYTGTGTPSSSQGNNGDIYLQTS